MPLMPFAVAAAATFNLVCAGDLATKALGTDTTEPFSYTYRMDLDKKVFCDGECKAQLSLKDVTPVAIILKDEKTDTPSGDSFDVVTINRETGEFNGLSTSKRRAVGAASIMILKWTGKCEKTAFTGFPTIATKF